MRKPVGTVATLGLAVLISGCGGGGQSKSPVLPAVGKTQRGPIIGSTKARLTIKMAIRKAGAATKSSRRKPQYVSSATAGIAIRTGAPDTNLPTDPPTPGSVGAAAWQLFDVSANAPACSTTGFVRTCVISVTVPVPTVQPWTDDFQVIATDIAPKAGDTQPVGNWLSAGDTVQAVTAGAENPVSVTLTGVIGSLAAVDSLHATPSYSVWAAPGQTSTFTVPITANDIDGGAIAGNPPTFENLIAFSDVLGASSPFTYPSASLPANRGLQPPATPGSIPAVISYLAPMTGTAGSTTVVTMNTIAGWITLPAPGEPTTTFALNPMIVSAAGAPVASIPNLMVGSPDVTVTVSEAGASSFMVATSDTAFLTLSPTGTIQAVNGTATFTVHAISATTAAATITVTDTNLTSATLSAAVAPAGAPSPTPTPTAPPSTTPTPFRFPFPTPPPPFSSPSPSPSPQV